MYDVNLTRTCLWLEQAWWTRHSTGENWQVKVIPVGSILKFYCQKC